MVAALGALLSCCPAVALLNLIVAVIAWVRVRGSGGTKRGVGLALAAMVVSVLLGTLAGVLGERVARASEATMTSQVREGITQLIQGEVDPSAWWLDSTPAALAAFQEQVHTRLGKPVVTTVTMTSTEVGLPTLATFRFLLERDGTTRVGSVACVVSTDPTSWLPQVRFSSMRINLEADAISFPLTTMPPGALDPK